MNVIVLLVTTPSGESEKVAHVVLESRLAACVNIVPQMKSMYWWEGSIQSDSESLLLIKTTDDQVEAIRKAISENISYEIFEMLGFEVSTGNLPYLNWVTETVDHESS